MNLHIIPNMAYTELKNKLLEKLPCDKQKLRGWCSGFGGFKVGTTGSIPGMMPELLALVEIGKEHKPSEEDIAVLLQTHLADAQEDLDEQQKKILCYAIKQAGNFAQDDKQKNELRRLMGKIDWEHTNAPLFRLLLDILTSDQQVRCKRISRRSCPSWYGIGIRCFCGVCCIYAEEAETEAKAEAT